MTQLPDPSPVFRPLRIGIADDDRASRRLLSSAVERLGHLIICAAANGEEFLAAVAGQDIDLAIVDLDMPVMDGLALADEVHRTRGTPVILVSGHPDMEAVVFGNEPVAVCVHKPVSLESLKAAIEGVAAGDS
jgi:CheY-like chemotaxis protein